MRDFKTYLSVAPVLSTLWFGSLAGILINQSFFFSRCVDISLFSF